MMQRTRDIAGLERVALFLPSLGGGGAERNALVLSRSFLECGLELDLVVAEGRGSLLEEVDPRVRLFDLHSPRVFRALPGLVRYLRRERPDVLLSSIEHANLVAIAARFLSRAPTLLAVSTHGSILAYAGTSRRRLDRWMPRLVGRFYRYADVVVAVSQALAAELHALSPRSRVRVIPNPVSLASAGGDVAPEWVGDGSVPVVVGIGRLEREKGFDVLVRAFAVAARERDLRLLILGEGSRREELEGMVRELGLEGRVVLPGFIENPRPAIAAADLLVSPSRFEGFGNVIVEALACGTPVVATDSGGPAEILDQGRHGRLVASEDAEALARAILAALDDEIDPATLRARAEDFEAGKIAESYLACFREARTDRSGLPAE